MESLLPCVKVKFGVEVEYTFKFYLVWCRGMDVGPIECENRLVLQHGDINLAQSLPDFQGLSMSVG